MNVELCPSMRKLGCRGQCPLVLERLGLCDEEQDDERAGGIAGQPKKGPPGTHSPRGVGTPGAPCCLVSPVFLLHAHTRAIFLARSYCHFFRRPSFIPRGRTNHRCNFRKFVAPCQPSARYSCNDRCAKLKALSPPPKTIDFRTRRNFQCIMHL